MTNEIKIKWQVYKTNEMVSDNLQAKWENDPENAELEAFADVAYENMWKALEEFASALVEFTGGAVDFLTAKRMAANVKYADRLAAIMERVA